MPRRHRVSPIGFPQHIIQRGNNKHVCFCSDGDRKAYIAWLRDYAQLFNVDIHAWVLMTNHVHLLCTPHSEEGVSKMMQALGRMYVSHFNYTYQRSGTLWEGRFKSCLVDSQYYLMALYRYIELNPVRAGMVNDPRFYSWSSFQYNAFGIATSLMTPHQLYLELGDTPKARQAKYRSMIYGGGDETLIAEIRQCANSGLALGNDKFKQEIELLTGESVARKTQGRPKK